MTSPATRHPAAWIEPVLGIDTEEIYECLGLPLGSEEVGRLGQYRVVKLLVPAAWGPCFRPSTRCSAVPSR